MPKDALKFKVLFLCTGNSCRSQMAEGWTRFLLGDIIRPYSAGTNPRNIDTLAVKAMRESGVDISGQRSKHLSDLGEIEFDLVITVCDNAREACPLFPGKAEMIHRSFDDPPVLVQNADTEEEKLVHYRRVRDEIRAFVEKLPGLLAKNQNTEKPIQ